jgi:pimeloyl-ACP methyl ester carboxylesterase
VGSCSALTVIEGTTKEYNPLFRTLKCPRATAALAAPVKPTVVLVHGAFADSSSWNGVVKILEKDGNPVIAASNPLRSLKGAK